MRKLRDFILLICLLLPNFIGAMESDLRCEGSYEECCGRAIFCCLMHGAYTMGPIFMRIEGMSLENKRFGAGLFATEMAECGLRVLLGKDGNRSLGCGDHSCFCGLMKQMIARKHKKKNS